MRLAKSAVAIAVTILMIGSASANEFEGPLKEVAAGTIKSWLKDPAIVGAIKEQNQKHAGLSQADIDKMDKQWRAQAGASDQPLIKSVLANSLSNLLKSKKEGGQGLFSEIFVMDAKGLNVGQSDVTSDYWQGDEAKWKKTFLAGPQSVHISEVEKDESTQTFQSQVSLPVVDPANNQVIGAITVGVNVEQLAQ